MPFPDRMTPQELRASVGLAGIFGLRMLGMFIILPVFALHAERLPGGHDHTLVGLALGAYGLTQACLQVPFGWLSDRWGRKRTIYLGLVIFALGSFLAALAQDITMVILGRVIQGGGAISAAVLALTADLTRDDQRTKAMAIIGMTIGVTFALSMVAGPVLDHLMGVPGIFALTGFLALAAIAVVRFVIPDPSQIGAGRLPAAAAVPVGRVLLDQQLLRLNYGIFALHAVLMALFVVVPFSLRVHLPASSHWMVYLPIMCGAFVLMLPPMLAAERKGLQKPVFIGAVGTLIGALLLLALGSTGLAGMATGLLVFFAAFNLLEATLPSLISKLAPAGTKGAAIGVYSSGQFIGTFTGAVAGGWLSQHYGAEAVFGFCAVLAVVWLLLALGMRVPESLDTRRYQLPTMDSQAVPGLTRRLAGLPGVREVMLSGEGVAYLKVDSQGFDEQNVIKLLGGEI
ncbi:MAG TPA: MFS transporter [Burkholderiales bacterium]|jgi:MFS family permease|nr:MFS transporter [Burkholderiales bacterium]